MRLVFEPPPPPPPSWQPRWPGRLVRWTIDLRENRSLVVAEVWVPFGTIRVFVPPRSDKENQWACAVWHDDRLLNVMRVQRSGYYRSTRYGEPLPRVRRW